MRNRSHPLELLRQAAAGRAAAGVRRALVPRRPGHDGLVDLASNDYLGLCGDKRLTDAAAATRLAATAAGLGLRVSAPDAAVLAVTLGESTQAVRAMQTCAASACASAASGRPRSLATRHAYGWRGGPA